jgi:hypothetical protein
LKAGPRHIINATEYEPLYEPQDNILEECLRREAERIASHDTLINRTVYDSMIDHEKLNAKKKDEEEPEPEIPEWQEGRIPAIPTPDSCDNDAEFTPWWKLKSKEDTTLQFESRFESANLRRAV